VEPEILLIKSYSVFYMQLHFSFKKLHTIAIAWQANCIPLITASLKKGKEVIKVSKIIES